MSPLARATDWYETPCPSCGAPAHRDTDVTDNFLCSGWYFLRYPSADCDAVPFDTEMTRRWLPVDSYIGGNEHAVLHLMYARFLTMALADLGELGVRRAVRQVPRPRPAHPRRPQDVQEPRQRHQAG